MKHVCIYKYIYKAQTLNRYPVSHWAEIANSQIATKSTSTILSKMI